MKINDIIKSGESSLVEFKNENFHNDSLAKEIVAFANFHGGTIYIGIDDNKTISGTSKKNLEEKIVNICRNNIIPSLIPQINAINIKEEQIIEVYIDKGRFKPYKVKSSNKFYIRVGSVSIEPTNEELIRLFQEGQQIHFEVSSVVGTTIENINLPLFCKYCKEYRDVEFDDIGLEKILYNWQLINEDKHLTVDGLLFFSKDSNRYLPQSGMDLFHFEGDDSSTNILDMKTENATIPYLIDTALKFVRNNTKLRTEFIQDDTLRKDTPEYPSFVIRELLSNAFIHRDWSIFGQKIKLSIFNNRIELFSPGKLPNTMNLTRALNGVSYYRNPIIAQLLKDYGFAEKAGRGLLKIMNYYKNNKLKLPSFDDDNTYFKVTVFKI